MFRKHLITVSLLALLALLGATGAIASKSVSTTGASATATGWYYHGVNDRGTVRDTKADGHCAYAQITLALAGYNDYYFNHEVCGNGNAKSWDHVGVLLRHEGPILSFFSSGVIQGVYLKACIDNRTWPLTDTCSANVKVGDYGSASAMRTIDLDGAARDTGTVAEDLFGVDSERKSDERGHDHEGESDQSHEQNPDFGPEQ